MRLSPLEDLAEKRAALTGASDDIPFQAPAGGARPPLTTWPPIPPREAPSCASHRTWAGSWTALRPRRPGVNTPRTAGPTRRGPLGRCPTCWRTWRSCASRRPRRPLRLSMIESAPDQESAALAAALRYHDLGWAPLRPGDIPADPVEHPGAAAAREHQSILLQQRQRRRPHGKGLRRAYRARRGWSRGTVCAEAVPVADRSRRGPWPTRPAGRIEDQGGLDVRQATRSRCVGGCPGGRGIRAT